jgi:hypothetical protein
LVQCYYCLKDAKALSEKVNASGDLKVLQLDCGHTINVAVIQKLSHFSTSELQKRLRYNKGLAKMRNISKVTRESVVSFIPVLEAELADRRA